MTKEERLKWLKQIESDICVCSLDSTFADDAKSCAIRSAIDELEQHRWIPVTERLPEEETDVLVCNKDGKIELTCGSRSTEVDGFIWYTSGWKFGDVVAWMPLPKPYEGSESDG